MRVYNTLSREVEEVKPIEEGQIKMYCCGPTVYDFAHIGNLRTFIFYDILKRAFTYAGFVVNQVINITDVDDKTIKRSRQAGVSLKEYTDSYTKHFIDDLKRLNIEDPTIFTRATEHIPDMEALILDLIEKGYAYKTDDGVYYDISKFSDYGKLSRIKVSGEVSRVKNDEYDKEEVSDFALWKAWSEDDGDVYWENKLPKGRPGWHIECSAMSMKYLGETIDIHSGAVDLMFPHHENEIAQSEAHTGKKFVNYWIHPEHLLVNGQKMSKRYKNYYTLRDLETLGFDPISYRLLVLDHNYRTKMDFNLGLLEKYEKTLNDVDIKVRALEVLKSTSGGQTNEDVEKAAELFDAAIKDDLDTHTCLIAMFKVLDEISKRIEDMKITEREYQQIKEKLAKFDSVLGIIEPYKIPLNVLDLAEERRRLRSEKKWKEADEKRNVIREIGFNITDLGTAEYVITKHRKYS